MVRIFKSALTGREVRVLDGSRTARLAEADDNWTETTPKPTKAKEASDAARKPARRRGTAQSKPDA